MINSNIPKKIHYCRFGGKEKSKNFQTYKDSRTKYCPDYEIKERNESNFDKNISSYTQKMYQEQKRAFVVDYARFWILLHEGGIYVDTDIEIIKNLDPLRGHQCFM